MQATGITEMAEAISMLAAGLNCPHAGIQSYKEKCPVSLHAPNPRLLLWGGVVFKESPISIKFDGCMLSVTVWMTTNARRDIAPWRVIPICVMVPPPKEQLSNCPRKSEQCVVNTIVLSP